MLRHNVATLRIDHDITLEGIILPWMLEYKDQEVMMILLDDGERVRSDDDTTLDLLL